MNVRLLFLVLPLLLIQPFLDAGAYQVQQPDVEIRFAWFDWGFVILVWNKGDESIYHVTLESFSLSGLVFLGSIWLDYIDEVGEKSLRQLIIPAYGIGRCLVEATVSYEYEGKTYERTIYGFFVVWGSTTYLIQEW